MEAKIDKKNADKQRNLMNKSISMFLIVASFASMGAVAVNLNCTSGDWGCIVNESFQNIGVVINSASVLASPIQTFIQSYFPVAVLIAVLALVMVFYKQIGETITGFLKAILGSIKL